MPHISYSELKDWVFCAFYHKLTRIEKLKGFKGNEYTAFGTAVHNVCEKKLLKENIDFGVYFTDSFADCIDKLPPDVTIDNKLVEPIKTEEGYRFKGYIDAVVVTPDKKVHIFDWKTCSWGWDAKRRSDKMTTYQLTLYKHFFAQKMDIEPKEIETHFALLKRTAKKNKVEFFRVTSGPRKTENALKMLNKALHNIKKERYIKNRLSCRNCNFRHTEQCP